MPTTLELLGSIGTGIAGISRKLPIKRSCLLCARNTVEAAKHPVLDGKYVKVQCVHKSVPRIIE
jgi:hypothetical protein